VFERVSLLRINREPLLALFFGIILE